MTPNDLDYFDNRKEETQSNLSGKMCVFPNFFFEAEIQSRIQTWLLSVCKMILFVLPCSISENEIRKSGHVFFQIEKNLKET